MKHTSLHACCKVSPQLTSITMAVTLPHCKHPLTTYERFVLTITMQQCRQQPALQLPHGKLMHSSGGTAHTSQTMLSISTDAYLPFYGAPWGRRN